MSPAASPSRFVSHGLTDVGLVRRRNEDAYLDRPELGLWAVADGMGGHEAGDVASGRIVAALGSIEPASDLDVLRDAVERQLGAVDGELRARAGLLGPDALIASTVVVLLARGDSFCCVWAGDSRLYRRRDGELRQLTTDHSRVQEMISAGVLSEAAARHHPERNIVTQAIGGGDFVVGRVGGAVAPGDCFLLCSDGLTNMLSDAEIGEELAVGGPDSAARRLLERVLARGAIDNVTIVIVAAEPAV